jgi:hypothetical protein
MNTFVNNWFVAQVGFVEFQMAIMLYPAVNIYLL